MSGEAGERLRAARIEKGLAVDEIAASLKVPARYIDAIERNDPAGLPEPAFVRGYVRGYARLVGLDPEPLLSLLAPVEIKAPRQQVGISDVPTRKDGRSFLAGPGGFVAKRHHRVAAALLFLGAAGWATWTAFEPEPEWNSFMPSFGTTEQAPAATQILAPSTELALPTPPAGPALPEPAGAAQSAPLPVPAEATPVAPPAQISQIANANATAAVQPPPAGEPAVQATPPAAGIPPTGLHVRFTGDCWIEVRDADNQVIHHSNRARGMDFSLVGKGPLTITLGNAANAALWWNGDPVKVDAFSRAGVARVNVGQPGR